MAPFRRIFGGLILSGAALAGCQNGPAVAPLRDGAHIALKRLPQGDAPKPVPGVCWASDTTPAVIETVTEQVMVRPERRNKDGVIIQAAQFETKTAQRLVQDRETVWFHAPCPQDMTVPFVASLQRALKARGRFYNPITGIYDADTGEAVRKLQAERGLDSPVLSLDAARDLGLSASAR